MKTLALLRWLVWTILAGTGLAVLIWVLAQFLQPAGDTADVEPGPPLVIGFGHVDVHSGTLDVFPAAPGRVVRIYVQEGEEVRKGQPLFEMDDRLARERLREAEASQALAQVRLDEACLAPARHRSLVAQQKAAVEARENALAAARWLLTRQEQMLKSNLVTGQEVRAARAQAQQLEARLRAEREKLGELQLSRPANQIAVAEAEVLAAQARLGQAKLSLDECTVRSPVAATVLRLRTAVGQWAGPRPDLPALYLCPRQERIVRVEIQQQYANRVGPGSPAWIEDDPPTGLAWRGTVQLVSNWITRRRSLSLEPYELSDVRTVEVIVRIDSGSGPVRFGQRVLVRLGPPPGSGTP